MVPSFAKLVTGLQSLLSKGFLFAGLFPVAVFGALSAGLAWWCWPARRTAISGFLGAGLETQAPNWLALSIVLLVGAFVLWGLGPALRRILEGQIFSAGVFQWLLKIPMAGQRVRSSRLQRRIETVENELFELRSAHSDDPERDWRQRLRAARNAPAAPPPADTVALDPLTGRIDGLIQTRSDGEEVEAAGLRTIEEALESELRRHPPDAIPRDLDRLQTRFLDRLAYPVWQDRERELRLLEAERNARFPRDLSRLGATRMANVAEIHRELGIQRYGVEPELIWPRIVKLVHADEQLKAVLDGARTQLEFAVSMTFLFGFFTAVWVVLTLLTTPLVLPFLTVALVGPLATAVMYAMAVESHQAFNEAVRSATDLHRFGLLESLRVPLPYDSEEERRLWSDLLGPEPSRPVVYEHPDGGES